MNRLGLVLLACLAAVPASAVSPDPRTLEVSDADTFRAKELVRRLGSESYPEREQAHRQLAEMGRLAKPALAEAIESARDPEVLRRAIRLLPRAVDEDMKARVAAFLADSEGRYDHDFPGWTPYREIVGTSVEARSLFAEMVKDKKNATLLAALEGPAAELTHRFLERRLEVYYWKYPRTPNTPRRDPTLADLVTLLLVETTAPVPHNGTGLSVGSMFVNTTFFTGNLAGAQGQVVKKLLNRWMLSRNELNFLNQALMVANRFELSAAPACAAKILAVPGATGYIRGSAITTIARSSARDQLPALEKLLTDESICTRVRVAPPKPGVPTVYQEVKVQDFALAAAAMVTSQKPEDYGFKEYTPSTAVSIRSRYLPYYLPPESRTAAFEKWKEWRTKNPDPKKPTGGKKD